MDKRIATRILLEAKELFDNCHVEFFLICGTCLGAIREHDIIPSDGDIDLGVMHDLLRDNVTPLTIAFSTAGYAVETRSCQYGYVRSLDFRKEGIHICVRDYNVSGDKVFHARIIAPDNDRAEGTCSVFDKKLFDNLKTIDFLGTQFFVPNPPEEFMEAHYGQGWNVPVENDSECRADVVNSFKHLMLGKK